MFKILCLCVVSLVGASLAASMSTTTEKLKYEVIKNPDGSFVVDPEASESSFREETAQVVNVGAEDDGLEMPGTYSYIDDNGQLVEVHYTAGKDGFVPVSTKILPADAEEHPTPEAGEVKAEPAKSA